MARTHMAEARFTGVGSLRLQAVSGVSLVIMMLRAALEKPGDEVTVSRDCVILALDILSGKRLRDARSRSAQELRKKRDDIARRKKLSRRAASIVLARKIVEEAEKRAPSGATVDEIEARVRIRAETIRKIK
jgi:hypothetical protein